MFPVVVLQKDAENNMDRNCEQRRSSKEKRKKKDTYFNIMKKQ